MAKKTASTPRISVNKLAEFTRAKANRQRQILRDQKFPTDFKGPYYREATEAISKCLASGLEDVAAVERAIRLLEQQTPEKIGTQRRLASNIDALESFLLMLDDIDLKGMRLKLGDNSPPKLTLQNVDISIRPEVLVEASGRNGATLVGAIKLHFPVTFPLDDDCAGMASALVQEWCKAHLPKGATHGPLCPVLDIGSRRVCAGVKSTAARMKEVEANCRNIVALWPTITPED
jgi:hypothetical protein